MDKYIDGVKYTEDRMTSREKSLTPAILGMPSGSHGVKLSSNMNTKDKQDLLLKLEEWRQARKEKLTATILAKGKTPSSSKLQTTLPKPKIRTMSNPHKGTDAKPSQCEEKENVFDRLYKNVSKPIMKKPEENKSDKLNKSKNPQTTQYSKCPPTRKLKVPKVILMSDSDDSTPLDETLKDNSSPSSVSESENIIEGQHKEESDNSDCLPNERQTESILSDSEEESSKEQDETETQIDIVQSPVISEKINLSALEEPVSKEQIEISSKTNVESLSVELPQAFFSNSNEKISKELEVTTSNDNLESSLVETKEENNIMIAECNASEPENEVVHKNDDLVEDKEDVNIDVKKNICFETPKEKILSAVHLRNKLDDWLIENGHSIDSYKQLRCFGLNAEKTPIPYHRQAKVDDLPSFNSSFYSTAPNTPMPEVFDESDKENVTPKLPVPKTDVKEVEGWLSDLHQLIVNVGYPGDRCEEWLNAITKKFPNCTQLPIYWECLAAVNGNRNELKSLEEFEEAEKREGEDHDSSLAGMFDKLVIDEKCHSASKTERGLSMKNIFKTKTVKFALHEKAVKELNPESGTEGRRKVLVATPVRRSARLQTPDSSKIINSLRSLDPETRRSISFQCNDALLTG